MDRGCKTPEGAMRKYDIARKNVWVYGCNECGMVIYDRYRSRYSLPIECPRCECDNMIESIGPIDFFENEYRKKARK